jgi:hypothetical protein
MCATNHRRLCSMQYVLNRTNERIKKQVLGGTADLIEFVKQEIRSYLNSVHELEHEPPDYTTTWSSKLPRACNASQSTLRKCLMSTVFPIREAPRLLNFRTPGSRISFFAHVYAWDSHSNFPVVRRYAGA